MNKESIYRLIGYQGEYNQTVKKALKKLLKENHPDHNGDVKVFKLINEVKKELENNQVSFNYTKKDYVLSDIDYYYCEEMLMKCQKEEERLQEDLKIKRDKLNALSTKYADKYYQSINKKGYILGFQKQDVQKAKNRIILLLVFCCILFGLSIIFQKIWVFALFVAFVLMLVFYIYYWISMAKKIESLNKKNVKKYFVEMQNVKEIIDESLKIKEEINELEKKLNKVQNNLRFYDNILKYK